MDLNRKPLTIAFSIIGVVGTMLTFSSAVSDLSTMVPVVASVGNVCVCVAAAILLHTRLRLPAVVEMGLVLAAFFWVVAMAHLTYIASDDQIYRMRSHASLVLWKPLPAVFGIPVIPSAMFTVWALLWDVASLEMCSILHGDPNQLKVHVNTALLSLGWLAVSWMNSGRLNKIYDAQQALAAEKALLESIITMMCDASVWLSGDGGTVLRTDERFQMILGGGSIIGKDVRCALSGHHEQQRFHESLAHAKTAPVLLPTTLLTQQGVKIPVDLFVVGNRAATSHAASAPASGPAFLIGVRVASRHGDTAELGNEELGNAEIREEHARELALGHADHSTVDLDFHNGGEEVQSSVPETTTTGRVFDGVDIDRWLSGAGDSKDELHQSLERIWRLGQHERWLMSSHELAVDTTEILGEGSFGVVCAGRLHGSPIVVLFHGACVDPERGEVMLVLERVMGPDLRRYVVEHSTDAEVHLRFKLLLDVACALRYFHAQSPQIVHGDLKGSNILVEAACPRAKLVDFGLSRLLTKGARPLGGTLDWMAPEVIHNKDQRPRASADVFSFGRLAYMVVTCKMPLAGARRSIIIEMAKNGAMPGLLWQEGRPLHAECRRLCERLLSPQPENRPRMAEVHQEASAWQLPDLVERLPSIDLSRAEVAQRPRANRSAGQPGGEEQGELVLPGRLPTKEEVKKLMLLETVMQWNFRVRPNACCNYHVAIQDLQRVVAVFMGAPCQSAFLPQEGVQCSRCGILDMSEQSGTRGCRWCNTQASSWATNLASIEEAQESSSSLGLTRASL